ncbi:putative SepSecS/SepCysS family, pyridoxal phosphate-dependent transferase, major [Plasmopara halstedii]
MQALQIHMTKLVAVGVAHVINNAYGVQASKCVHEIELAMRSGRVDAVVQILDKTSWCPFIYPGRASSTPTLDFFITILQMGNRRLLNERKQVAGYMRMKLNAVAMEEGERVLHVLSNEVQMQNNVVCQISFAMTLTTLCPNVTNMQEGILAQVKVIRRCRDVLLSSDCDLHQLAALTRIVSCLDRKDIAGYKFDSYGAHFDGFPVPYVTFACTLGMEQYEVDVFAIKLRKTLQERRARKC